MENFNQTLKPLAGSRPLVFCFFFERLGRTEKHLGRYMERSVGRLAPDVRNNRQ